LKAEKEEGGRFARAALVLVGLMLTTTVCRMAWRLTVWPVSYRMEYELRGDLLAHLRSLDSSYYHHHPPGDLLSRATSDIEALRRFLAWGAAIFLDVLIVLPVALTLMLRMHWRLGVVVAVPILAAPLVSLFISRRIMTVYKESQKTLGLLSARAQEDIAGVRVLKTYAREDAAARKYGALNTRVRDLLVYCSRIYGLIGPYFESVPKVALLLLLIAASTWPLVGRCTLGELVAFQWYVALLAWPTMGVGWGLAMLQRMRASAGRLEEVFAAAPRPRPPAEAAPREARGRLAFRELSLSLGDTRVLDRLTLEAAPGETLGITGPTGSGKTTLLSLTVALIAPPPGTVFLDGRDVREIDPGWLRRQVALVQQVPYLFSRSLIENLAFARPDADPQDVHEAARVAGLQPDLQQLDEGFDTLVGDRGITLSGGQRLRVALGRALVARPAVLLLDDVFSAVDTYTEESVWSALRRTMAGRTMVITSHRASVLRRCDRIAVVEGGRVAEMGTHEALIATDGFYARSFALQEMFEQ
jgi:ATP-binding cassette subfamily B protein